MFFSSRTLCITLQTLSSTPLPKNIFLTLQRRIRQSLRNASHKFLAFYVVSWRSIHTYIYKIVLNQRGRNQAPRPWFIPQLSRIWGHRVHYTTSCNCNWRRSISDAEISVCYWSSSVIAATNHSVIVGAVIYSLDVLVFKSRNKWVCHLYGFFLFISSIALSALQKIEALALHLFDILKIFVFPQVLASKLGSN